MEYIDKYLQILEIQDELLGLNEVDLSAVISKFTPESKTKALVKNLKSAVNKKDPIKSLKNVKRLLAFIPKVNLKKVDSFITSKVDDYKNLKKMANTVLKNSLSKASDEALDYASSFLAMSSFVVPKGKNIKPRENLKNNIKQFVVKTRKFMDEQEDEQEKKKRSGFQKEDIPDLAIASVIVIMAITIVGGLGTGGYLILAAAAKNLPMILLIVLIIVVVGGLMMFIDKAMEATSGG